MNSEEWIANQPKFVELVESALAALNSAMDERYRELYGEDPVRCIRCNRILVPRRIWYVIPDRERYAAFVPIGKGSECHSCRITHRRANESGSSMPDVEISRLRALVGFNPNGRKVG